jgi:hypothetical protein
MTTKYQHCCEDMTTHIESKELYLNFSPKFREYGIVYADGGTSRQTIHFCPWCGSKLPASLRLEWFEELDRLGLEPDDKLPEELTSDEWWIKRAL